MAKTSSSMYTQSSIPRCFLCLLSFAALAASGFFLLNQVPGFSSLDQFLADAGQDQLYNRAIPYDAESFKEHREVVLKFTDADNKANGIDIIRSAIRWDFLFIIAYLAIGYPLIQLVKLQSERKTHAYQKSARLFLGLLGLADILENSLLLLLFSSPETDPSQLALIVRCASLATAVKLLSILVLFFSLAASLWAAFEKDEEPQKPEQSPADKPKRTPKNIILLSDGTGNASAKDRGTNVFKLFEALDLRDPLDGEIRQIAFYDDGVGTEGNRALKAFGGAFGVGLAQNVKQLYAELSRHYEPGDQIFLFGFSRGAFTVRTLSGLIARCGILRPNDQLEQLVEDLYHVYRKNYPTKLQKWLCNALRIKAKPASYYNDWAKHYVHPETDPTNDSELITFLGVWDTVDAYGLPWDEIATLINTTLYKFTFPDHELNKKVAKARHAVAIDDERKTFTPVLWDESDPHDQERIEQVWFAGVHSNVGGGYPRQGLSLNALNWMMKEAGNGGGLRFIPSKVTEFQAAANHYAHLYDSRAGAGRYYSYQPRRIEELCKRRSVKPKFHISAIRRIAYSPENYSPGNIPADLEIVDDNGQETYPAACALIKNALPSEPMLHQMRNMIRARQATQWIFWIGTALLAGWVFFGLDLTFGEAASLFGLMTMGIVAFLGLASTFNVLPALPRSLSHFSQRQQAYYSSCWNPIRTKLKELL
ncbi:DUF2235 domain-containing protein [Pelagicoccus sp. SDUM812002]|uniref:DUF2235 domain-containing protein n=1 Tax=Pelagicoccus sp. SDUM812002 TaxID=3041266 RepID=UPI00281090B5|nr:DUF2235 domain-containing protein [Pelagicoccus sp. SDUM812002]MDQ8188356.1 DUF2235 domain-containing protein [Pelagicoccus sp. SDUM812002]